MLRPSGAICGSEAHCKSNTSMGLKTGFEAFIANARAYLEIADRPGAFDAYIWSFTDGRVLRHRPLHLSAIASTTSLSEAMSKDLKRRGFRFVGPTICYAFMQAVGIVDEHQRNCWVTKRAA